MELGFIPKQVSVMLSAWDIHDIEIAAIATFLNNSGYKKKLRKNKVGQALRQEIWGYAGASG